MSTNFMQKISSFKEISLLAQEGKFLLKKFLNDSCKVEEFQSESEIKDALRHSNTYRQYYAMLSLFMVFSLYGRYYRLYPEVVNIMSTSNLELKRYCYIFIVLAYHTSRTTSLNKSLVNTSQQCMMLMKSKKFLSETTLLTLNCFRKDCQHRHHIIRAWALKTLTQLSIPECTTFSLDALQKGISDGSPFVRQVAANASIKLARSHTSYVGYAIGGVVPRLIGDVEDVVVASALYNLYLAILQLPNLAKLDPFSLQKCDELYNLNQFTQHFSTVAVESSVSPALSVLHPHFCYLVEQRLDCLPFYGQVAGIYMLTYYCRTFFPSPDDCSNELSGHYYLFLSKLIQLKHTTSPSVLIAISESILLLASKNKLPELIDQILPFILHCIKVSHQHYKIILYKILSDMTSYLPAKQLPFILSTLVIQDMDSTSIVISKIHLLQKLAIFPDYPVELICSDILNAVCFKDSHKELIQGIITILKIRLRENFSFSFENIIEEILQLLEMTFQQDLQNGLLHCLHEIIKLARDLHIETLRFILTLIAQHFVKLLASPAVDSLTKSLTACVQIFILYYSVSPMITLEIFRNLVKTIIADTPSFQKDDELLFSVLEFGFVLYIELKDTLTVSEDVFSRFRRLLNRFLNHLENSLLINKNVRHVSLFCQRALLKSYEKFSNNLKEYSSKSASPTFSENNCDNFENTEKHNDFYHHLPYLPTFCGIIKEETYRRVVDDKERFQISCKSRILTISAGFRKSTKNISEESEEIENFYGSGEWETSCQTNCITRNMQNGTLFTNVNDLVIGEELEDECYVDLQNNLKNEDNNTKKDLEHVCGSHSSSDDEWGYIKKQIVNYNLS